MALIQDTALMIDVTYDLCLQSFIHNLSILLRVQEPKKRMTKNDFHSLKGSTRGFCILKNVILNA